MFVMQLTDGSQGENVPESVDSNKYERDTADRSMDVNIPIVTENAST